MSEPVIDPIDFPQSELVIGLVAPVGTDTKFVVDTISQRLERFSYVPIHLKLSNYLKDLDLGVQIDESTPFKRVDTLMNAGDALRKKVGGGNENIDGSGEALALMAISAIHKDRPIDEKSREGNDSPIARPKTAYILESLKHPDEVVLLRRIYGDGFFLISISSSRETRRENLKRRGMFETEADILIGRDENESDPLGQKTRDAFHLADAFIDANDLATSRTQIERILDILFGDRYETPRFAEYAMFLAFASAFRSADLSRQVGAAIASETNEILAVGCNDVPRFGGGLYSSDDDEDHRDHKLGVDPNVQKRNEIFGNIAQMLKDKYPMAVDGKSVEELTHTVKRDLKASVLSSLTEFGRTVHAEMDAIVSCARSGISVRGGTLYTTTFPCHNCARHIIAAGIETVVYVEPYPKSQAGELHEDSIDLETQSANKVTFKPFVGIGSRRFMDLFSMGMSSGYPIERKSNESGEKLDWTPEAGRLRVPMLPTSYIERERLSIQKLDKLEEESDVDKETEGH
ncbi:MAG TPA: anti-phage dCTP deaminase [Pyrinomonadaceae bacterium]|nr:anti-phage dCTP deaminase [Pyrinomonadaceae bacterium]